MNNSTVSADLAASHGLPGLLGVNRHGARVFVELDLSKHQDRIDGELMPGIEAFVMGFLARLIRRSRSASQSDRIVAVNDGYVAASLHAEDLDRFLVGLAAMLNGSKRVEAEREPGTTLLEQGV